MLKRLIIAAIGVVGLVVIGLGIASATVWRADDVLVATTSGGQHTLVTDPGVLELGGDPVTVTVSVPDDGPVVLAIGRDTDVAGWVGTDAHGRVTGLSGWHTLAVEDVEAPAPDGDRRLGRAPGRRRDAAAPAPTESPAAEAAPTVADPTGSDLWVAQETGLGSAELVWPAQEGRWSLIAVSTGDAAPTLSLAWPRVVTTPWLWPCVAAGALLVLVSRLAPAARRPPSPRGARRADVALGQHGRDAGSSSPGDVDQVPVLTRRELREAAQARAARPRTGSLPKVPAPAPRESEAPAADTHHDHGGVVDAVDVHRGVVDRVAHGGLVHGGPPLPVGRSRPVGARADGVDPCHAAASRPRARRHRVVGDRPDAAPHGRPSWLQSTPPVVPTVIPRRPPPCVPARPTAPLPTPSGAATGCSAVPPPPGARLRPVRPPVPTRPRTPDGRSGRARPAGEQAAPADESATAGSRADAWRRAWGLPPTEGESDPSTADPDPTQEKR